MTNEIAERYAQGLFELARENKTVKEKAAQCEDLLKLMRQNPELLLLLQAVKVTKTEKKNLIQTVLKDVCDIDMIHFLKLLIDKGRIPYLIQALEVYKNLADEEMGILNACVYSARKLEIDDMQKIITSLEKKYQKKIQLANHVDESLIAGIKVVVGNHVTDLTTKTQIERMRYALLKGGQA